MKKFVAVLICIIITISGAGCVKKEPSSTNSNGSNSSAQNSFAQNENNAKPSLSSENNVTSSGNSSQKTEPKTPVPKTPVPKPPVPTKPKPPVPTKPKPPVPTKPKPPVPAKPKPPVPKPPVQKPPQPVLTKFAYSKDFTVQIQKQIENEIFNQVNALRKSKGLKPFKRNNLLDKAAAIRSKEMLENQKFSHIRPNGKTFYTTIQANNYKYITAGENIAYLNGYPIKRIAAEMMDGWIKSLPHYQAMIDGAAESTKNGYVDFGISVYYQNGVAYGTQHFGHPF